MLFLLLATSLVAQGSGPQWSAPTQLFASPDKTWTAIDADAWGRVHVFWTGAAPQIERPNTAIYHTHFAAGRWSAPAVLFASAPGGLLAAHLAVRSTADGWLHLVWSDRRGIQSSRAPCAAAADAGWWETPRQIGSAPGSDVVRIAARSERDLHVVYTRLGGDGGGDSGAVEYLRSSDGGATWSAPATLSEIAADPVSAPGAPRLLLDDGTFVHVVWDERSAPHWLGDRILYARSRDDGRSWEPPRLLAQTAAGGAKDRRTAPSIAAAAGALQVIYTCSFPARRCTRLSQDSGREWSPEQPFPLGDLVGIAEWDALLADARQSLHFVTQMREPRGMYYATRAPGGVWSAPLMLDAPAGWDDAHAPEMALSLGNQLHVVWNKSGRGGDVIHAVLHTGAAATAPAAAPPLPARPQRRPSIAVFAALVAATAALAIALFRALRRRR
jgi:hypothetical protein